MLPPAAPSSIDHATARSAEKRVSRSVVVVSAPGDTRGASGTDDAGIDDGHWSCAGTHRLPSTQHRHPVEHGQGRSASGTFAQAPVAAIVAIRNRIVLVFMFAFAFSFAFGFIFMLLASVTNEHAQ